MAAPPGILEVRCAGCGQTLEVEHGLTEFACPDCGMAQSLPPELMPPRPRRALPLPGRVAPYAAPPARVACGGCGSVLSVPHGPGRFVCPLCGAELASSPLAAVPVVTTPAAVPISSTRLPHHTENVQHRPLNQSARAGIVEKPIHSEHSHGQHPKQYFREESFGSLRADSRTQTDAVGRLENESLYPLVHMEKSHSEPVQRTIAMPGKKKYRFVFGPKSWQEGNVQEEQVNQVVCASQAQVIPTKSSVHVNQREGGFPYDMISMHNKQATEHVAAPSAMEHEQITSQHQVVHEKQVGEIPIDAVQSNQVVHALHAQVIPIKSAVHASQTEGGFPYDTISMHNKQATEHVAAPSAMEHEQITSQHPVVHEQQAGEIPTDAVQPNQVVRASHAQVIPAKSSVHANQTEGGFPCDMISMQNKHATEHVAALSAMEHEEITSRHRVVHGQQVGEIPSDTVQAEQEKVDSACKRSIENKKSTKNTKGNHKRENKKLMNSPNEWSHLRRSTRLLKGSPDFIDFEPIQKLDASPDQNHSEAPQIESTIVDPASSSPTRYHCPQAGSIELDNIDVTPGPTLNHGALQAEQFPHCYSPTYSPETRWVLLNPSSNSWNEIPQKSFNAIDQLDKSDDEVCLDPSENQNYMDGQVPEAACNGKNYSEQVQVKPHSKKFPDHGRQMNLAASCSRLAAMLPVPAATMSTIPSLSSLEKLPLQCSSPTTPQHQARTDIYAQDAQCCDMQSRSPSKSSNKRRGRPPALLMEPRKEADRPVLTPNGKDWSVHPPGPKVVTTLSLLIKQNYPGTCISVDTDGRSCEVVVHYWHQCPPDVRATVLDEFLKRYKWAPGQEEECQNIFERKAVRQLVNLFCYEKQRVREELAAKKSKRSSTIGRASGKMALEKGDDREASEERQGDESAVLIEHDDPLSWKPFVPDWMQPTWWEMLCDHWAKDEFMKVSYQKRKNRNAGSHPCDAAGSRSITTDQQDMTYRGTEEASNTPLGPHPVQGQVGSSKRGRPYGTPVASKKAQTDSSSKSSPDCLNKQGQQPRFTQEQVQQMINQALQGLNETWEKKFLSLEQNIRSMPSSRVVPTCASRPVVAAARDKQCQLARQDTLDSAEEERDWAAARDDGENQEEHWS